MCRIAHTIYLTHPGYIERRNDAVSAPSRDNEGIVTKNLLVTYPYLTRFEGWVAWGVGDVKEGVWGDVYYK